MRHRFFLLSVFFTLTCTAPSMGQNQDAGATRSPNVILVITDDQGYGDIAYHGNKIIKTPNLDRFFSQSLRATNFHVSPTCAPTRGALMTEIGRASCRES